MKIQTLLIIVLTSLSLTLSGKGVFHVHAQSTAVKLPSTCNNNALIENTKNQWWNLDKLQVSEKMLTTSKSIAIKYPAPYNWQWRVFQGKQDANWQIYRKRPDSLLPTPLENLSNYASNDRRPKINLDATRIVFVSDRSQNDDIYVMNIDGSELSQLTTHPSIDTMPTWSPDGKQILFVSTRNGNADLFIMDANGANQQQLTTSTADDVFPTWSPDRKQIAWVQIQGAERRLWVMNADGKNAHAITGTIHLLQNPIWSSKNNEIAFDFDSEDDDVLNEVGIIFSDGTGFRKPDISNLLLKDVWVTSWVYDATSVTITYIDWVCYGGGLLGLSEIGHAGVTGLGYPIRWDIGMSGAFPDLGSQDIWPPVTQVQPMPEYSRSDLLQLDWNGYDVGPSGIVNVAFETRREGSSGWEPGTGYWPQDKKLYFRSQGKDDADNAEAWPDSQDGDAQTEPFEWILNGRVSDNRNISLPGYLISVFPEPIHPVKTDYNGSYMAYRRGYDTVYTFDETTQIDPRGDASYVHYIEPGQNLIVNGSFEESTSIKGWSIADTATITTVTNIKHHLQQSVRLGLCGGYCQKSIPLQILPDNWGQPMQVSLTLVDKKGTIHFFGNDGNAFPIHQAYKIDGSWTAPHYFARARVEGKFSAYEDVSGNIHTFYSVSSSLFHTYLSPTDLWSSPLKLAEANAYQSILNTNGDLQVIYRAGPPYCISEPCVESELYSMRRPSSGKWTEPVRVWTYKGYPGSDFLVLDDRNGGIMVLFKIWIDMDIDRSAYYEIGLDRNDKIITHQITALPSSAKLRQWVQDSDENQFLFSDFGIYDQGQLNIRMAHNQWKREPIWVSGFNPSSMLLDKSGSLHFFGGNGNEYAIRSGEGIWSDIFKISNTNVLNIANEAQTNTFVTAQESYAQPETDTNLLDTEIATFSISQTISIASNLHEPTLSFMYEMIGPDSELTLFEVNINDGISTTQIFSTSRSTPWKLGWADMNQWSNQTVTVTFALHQQKDDAIKALYLDQVSLGSWLTAVPQSLSPDRFDVGQAPQVIIIGENFIATPEVILGTTKINDVQWLDEQHISFTPPSNLSAGSYDLFVTNPGASQTVLTSALRVGKQVYLPIVSK